MTWTTVAIIAVIAVVLFGIAALVTWLLGRKKPDGETSAADAVLLEVRDKLLKLERATELSPIGRCALADIMIFYQHPISLFPDSPERTDAEASRFKLYTFLGKAPAEDTSTPATPVAPKVS